MTMNYKFDASRIFARPLPPLARCALATSFAVDNPNRSISQAGLKLALPEDAL
jgi:hypothetical protein